MPSPDDSPALSKSARQRVLVVLSLSLFFSSTQGALMIALLPVIGESLSLSEGQLGTLLFAHGLVVALSSLIAGPLSDLFGRRLFILGGQFGLAGCLVAHLLATDYLSLLVIRILTGLSAGFLRGRATAYVSDIFELPERGTANSHILSGHSLGQLAGVPLGLLLVDQLPFQTIYALGGLALLACFAMGSFLLPYPVGNQYAQGSRWLGYRQDILALRSCPATLATVALGFGVFFASALIISFFPVHANQVLGLNSQELAVIFMAGGACQLLGLQAGGRLLSHRSPGFVIGSSLAVSAALGFGAFLVTDSLGGSTLVFAGILGAQGLRISPLQTVVTSVGDPRVKGLRGSLQIAANELGRGAGAAVAGFMYGGGGLGLLAAIGGGLSALMVLVARRLPTLKISHPASKD